MNKNQKIALAEKDLTVKTLGFKLDLHPTYISFLLTGTLKPPKTRKRICEILEKPESYLWPKDKIDS